MTAEDCVASIKRWAAKDATGQKLMTFVADLDGQGRQDLLIMQLKSPTGLVLLGARQALLQRALHDAEARRRDRPNTQISDFTGSGPFVFKKDEWKPGDKTVYVKFDKYKPRSEPASGLRRRQGGQGRSRGVARDLATTSRPSTRCSRARSTSSSSRRTTCCRWRSATPTSSCSTGIRSATNTPSGPNWLHKPFDNPKVRQALLVCLQPEGFPQGGRRRSQILQGLQLLCSRAARPSPPRRAWTACSSPNFKKAQELLKEAGYDGTPIVLMHSTDLPMLTNLAPVAKSLMEKAGFKVDMQSMDWQTLVARRAKKDPPAPAAGTPS